MADIVPRYNKTTKHINAWSNWINNKLKVGEMVNGDIDSVINDYKRKYYRIIEVKFENGELGLSEHGSYSIMSKALNIGLPAIGYKFRGAFMIQVKGVDFTAPIYLTNINARDFTKKQITLSDGRKPWIVTYTSSKRVTEEQLIKFLRYELEYPDIK